MCVIVDHGNTDRRCEWLKHKVDKQIRLQATCDSQNEGEDEVEERDGGVEECFDIDEIIEELEKEEARHAHGGEEDLDGADEKDEGKAGLPEVPIDHLIAPSMDPDQNPYVLFMHMNGLHSLPYIPCGCGGLQERIAGAVQMRLMPASFTIFKTMFTFDVLEDFRLANLECKTSAYQYYQLLWRKTEPLTPQVVVEQYAELWCLSQCWRWLKKLKWGAELAPFCPCCLQPGVNLPDNWKEDENKWVYHQTLMADGNFKADHIQQSTRDKDVWLSPGSSMLPHCEEYTEFLQAAENIKMKAPCENSFQAIENTLLYARTCDINGIVVIACPRHGCFAPGSVANLYRGKILELLWANLNAVTPAMRMATLAHQAEMLDDHICDSNHKKALNIVRMLCKQYVLTDKRAADAEDTRDEIAERVGARNIAAWTDAVVEAENTRYIDLSVMDIYGMSASYEDHLAVPAEDEPLNGEYQWIREAIEVQELQWHVLCQAKHEKISKSISDIALQSRVLGIDGSDIRNVDPPASMMGTKLLPGNTLFSNLNDSKPPDNDIDVDDKESSDEADVPMVLTAAIGSPALAEHPMTASPSHTGAHLHAENVIIPLPSTLDIIMQMMSTLEVVINDRMMDIVAHRQEVAALFDIYEAVIYKEADNADEAKTQQNTTELDDEIQRILDDNKLAPEHTN
ncbi:hypothetical protein BDN71DRAFT_1513940 [Pleurotus eryngii]|uniref:CxC2-like cysteine cluster KDZ transposase-associated domain-containing protein n=1 Tax=Pleurotus eryngii TaxID=5323 RepID=A0A9P6D8B2_PLEER|nr:hypothetical protein BDN71DRAFT_1513940 [Pleurotus eryngii]